MGGDINFWIILKISYNISVYLCSFFEQLFFGTSFFDLFYSSSSSSVVMDVKNDGLTLYSGVDESDKLYSVNQLDAKRRKKVVIFGIMCGVCIVILIPLVVFGYIA
jgi:hypothetical protein